MKGTLGSSGEQSRGARHVEAGLLDCLYRHRERERQGKRSSISMLLFVFFSFCFLPCVVKKGAGQGVPISSTIYNYIYILINYIQIHNLTYMYTYSSIFIYTKRTYHINIFKKTEPISFATSKATSVAGVHSVHNCCVYLFSPPEL